MTEVLPRLDVWYMSDQSLCNFDCSYCCSAKRRTPKDMWRGEDSVQRFDRIIAWIGNLPYSVGARLATAGEPFVTKDFLRGAARLTRSPNMRFVELQTNGSLLKTRLAEMSDEFGADFSKLSLWITFHHTEITADKVIENALFAQERGIFVVVNTLFFPDNRNEVERLINLCDEHGLRVNLELGQSFGEFQDAQLGDPHAANYTFVPIDAEGSDRFNALIERTHSRQMVLTSMVAAEGPYGLGCSAGSDYLYVHWDGDVFPCRAYGWELKETKVGSALDEAFVPPPRAKLYAPCILKKGCNCKEDYTHLEVASPGPPRDKSLGYWPDASASSTPERVRGLEERLQRARRAGVLKVLT